MEYGCIGEVLKHSFSKEIHGKFASYDYSLCEVKKDELDSFISSRDFRAINVTIPYKEAVIPYLYYIDDSAKGIGAVNTIVNRDGKLFGYNTDFFGMKSLLAHAKISVSGKKVLILGTGGTSKTAMAVAESLGAKEIIRASRSGKEAAVMYTDIYKYHTDAEIIINTTPSGMYPNLDGEAIDIDYFPSLLGVIDAVYNPLRTRLISRAVQKGIPAEGGLYMLVAQAVRASEIFLDTVYPEDTTEHVFEMLRREKENIVLIGMPACGKTTVGGILSRELGRELVDTDDLIRSNTKMEIPEIFKERGESGFRDIESEAIRKLSEKSGLIIATGGGAILREENVFYLKQNGRMYFLDRSPEKLIPTSDRPLSSTKEAIYERYRERYPLYRAAADVIIPADTDADDVAKRIITEFLK